MTRLEMMKVAHRTLAEYRYELQPVVHGYANRTLYVNLAKQEISEKSVAQQMNKDIVHPEDGIKGELYKALWTN
ncbi:MAG: hypothetical protein U9R58_07245 [Chloroflexota bacterium]|nr:hypothetical protein [Chloroflexota bacterium]